MQLQKQISNKIVFLSTHLTLTDIGCASNSDCPSQRACINSKCINPCNSTNLCDADQECQVENHQPVCLKGKFSKSETKGIGVKSTN